MKSIIMLLVCAGTVIATPSYAGADKEHGYKFSMQVSRPEQLRHANELYRNGQAESSLPLYEKVLEGELSRFTAYETRTNYCAALIESGGYLQAKLQCEEAISLIPWKWPARFNLGVIFHHMGLYEAAIAEFEMILAKVPENMDVQNALKKSRNALEHIAPYVRKKAMLGGQAI